MIFEHFSDYFIHEKSTYHCKGCQRSYNSLNALCKHVVTDICNWNYMQLRGWLYVHAATCTICVSKREKKHFLHKPCFSIFLQAYERIDLNSKFFLSGIDTSKINEKAKRNTASMLYDNVPESLPPSQTDKPPPPIRSEIKKHTQIFVPNRVKKNNINTIQCPICQYHLESDEALFKHAAQCREKAPFSCKHCDQRFTHRVLYKTHMRDAHDEFKVKFRL